MADSGNDRIERFNLTGGEAIAWGTQGSGLGQFSYPRGVAANETEVIVSDDDNHRIERFTPDGAFQAAVGSYGSGPGQFGFPYGVALDANQSLDVTVRVDATGHAQLDQPTPEGPLRAAIEATLAQAVFEPARAKAEMLGIKPDCSQ